MIDFSFIINILETEEQRITADNICNEYYEFMYKISFKILRNVPDAEDAVIQTVINICKSIDNFIGKQQLDIKRMVGRYTYNVAVNIYKKNKLIQEHIAIINENEKIEDSLTDDDYEFITDPNNYGVLQKYVVKLDTITKQLLVHRYVHGLSCKVIGKMFDIPASTVSTKINRALKKMKEMYLKDQMKGGADTDE